MKRFVPILGLTALCWLVFLVNNIILHSQFEQYGIVPRHIRGQPGILWAPFLHASFRHIAANTMPLLILGAILCARSRGEFFMVTFAGVLLGGGLTWLMARTAVHIGASGLIFCYFGYIASLAWFRRTFGTLCLSVICVLAYGGMLRGIIPSSPAISWEGHAAGLLAGILIGGLAAKLDKTPSGTSTAQPQPMTQPRP
jgi:membrane associated rhomboid family serine protease